MKFLDKDKKELSVVYLSKTAKGNAEFSTYKEKGYPT